MGQLFGPNILQHLMLALSGALVVGNVVALFRPPPEDDSADAPTRAPLVRSLVMIVIGLIVAGWTIASLVS